ncbi:N-acetylmuramoyl-L-alanine amidase [Azospirillum oryzae]|uniref:N-acetylmuramoyl-L-alanine amidase n=1 Tax=Azospirillum oryzae TaxID=286727 RepID=A0A6N1AJV5_9PROT|nr:N-acetylmuramoyl-L-alanine amidase [Azospirillum oryzae]KAA0589793.1 N-acetylmuramoyl-L-alanine amidase [Azospirillum oryzae]QKS51629.1 N-acetylmuramoyl-L-alanine amidase [Azospirillum oryzae]GLR81628.1 N-acetylmuramoyl-L-alanine amidase [Azospirillum oryzae]
MSAFRRIDRPSPNHGPRADGSRVELLILHYTGMPTAADALDRLCDPAAQVSAHYTVDEDGTIFAHVPEDRRAWHAGRSGWRGTGDVNSRSIGVEIVNPGHEFGYRPFPPAQMAAVAELCQGIVKRHGIPAGDVLGHSDVAPDRKEDPGELFDWPGLAAQGIGIWPTPSQDDDGPFNDAEVAALLGRYGYDPAEPRALLAFQRHFHPECLTGIPDPETVRRLRALLRLTGR